MNKRMAFVIWSLSVSIFFFTGCNSSKEKIALIEEATDALEQLNGIRVEYKAKTEDILGDKKNIRTYEAKFEYIDEGQFHLNYKLTQNLNGTITNQHRKYYLKENTFYHFVNHTGSWVKEPPQSKLDWEKPFVNGLKKPEHYLRLFLRFMDDIKIETTESEIIFEISIDDSEKILEWVEKIDYLTPPPRKTEYTQLVAKAILNAETKQLISFEQNFKGNDYQLSETYKLEEIGKIIIPNEVIEAAENP